MVEQVYVVLSTYEYTTGRMEPVVAIAYDTKVAYTGKGQTRARIFARAYLDTLPLLKTNLMVIGMQYCMRDPYFHMIFAFLS